MLFHKLAATVFGIGYLGKGVGTVAAFFGCLVWYACFNGYTYPPVLLSLLLTLAVTLLGVISGNKVEPLWGKDHGRVVIDELSGIFISLLFVPVTIPYLLAAFVLFRFYDIAKPLYIRRLEALPGGWGVMADDALAGVYANITLQVIIYLQLF